MKRISLILCTMLLWIGAEARAELIRTPYPGVRPTGMGGAFLAVSDDNNALWYNPAGLAKIRGVHFNVIDIGLGVDSSDTLSRITNAAFSGGLNNLVRTDEEMARLTIRPTFIIPYFGISVFENLNGYFNLRAIKDFDIMNPATYQSKIDVYAFNDIGINAGIGIPMGEVLAIGASVRAFQRTSIDASIGAQDLLASLSLTQPDFMQAAYTSLKGMQGIGLGLGLNLGALVTVPLPKDYPTWTIAATAEDVGRTSFRPLGSMRAPKGVDSTYHFGTALKYNFGRDRHLTLALDYRNAFEKLPITKQLYLGTEYRFKYVGLRGGLHQGYLSGGFSLEFPPHTRLHLSTYASETGDGLWKSNQRWYLMQFIIGFNPI